MAVSYEPGAEPSRRLVESIGASGSGDRLRAVIERDSLWRKDAVAQAWDRWPEKSTFTYPFSSRPPIGVRAGVIDLAVRRNGVTVAMVVDDIENKVLGMPADLVSIAPLTLAQTGSPEAAVERETERTAAIEAGAGAPLGGIPRQFGEVFKGARRTVVTVAVIAVFLVGVFVFGFRSPIGEAIKGTTRR